MELTDAQQKDIQENKDIAAFSYIWIMSVLVLGSRRDSQFVQFHARQAVVLFIFSVIFYVLPYVKYLNVFVVAAMITGFIRANMGEYYEMPIVSDIVRHQITVGGVWQFVKEKSSYVFNFIKRLFRKGPRIVVESSVDAISRIRGVDVLKVNSKLEELQKEFNLLLNEKVLLETQLHNFEAEFLIGRYMQKMDFAQAPSNIQTLTNEILKKVNLMNLKYTQEDFAKYIVFKNSIGASKILLGDFSEDGLALIVASDRIKNTKEYALNFNNWHGIKVTEVNKTVLMLLANLQ